ncbi:hypothetical protein M7I_4575 [Glarea lozoyensis 74030]|uniref:Uncharacterized protein n=1 Tax=Glarea lozoyensis (strain ATCC 74030 / MF5533) TaxID=1104152 RepID=H0EPJ4_GLAL7|nr:hypothetical protein M7I_4575 [Glarea lozoyensis 74030]
MVVCGEDRFESSCGETKVAKLGGLLEEGFYVGGKIVFVIPLSGKFSGRWQWVMMAVKIAPLPWNKDEGGLIGARSHPLRLSNGRLEDVPVYAR